MKRLETCCRTAELEVAELKKLDMIRTFGNCASMRGLAEALGLRSVADEANSGP